MQAKFHFIPISQFHQFKMIFWGGGGKGSNLLHSPILLTKSKLFLADLCQNEFLLDYQKTLQQFKTSLQFPIAVCHSAP